MLDLVSALLLLAAVLLVVPVAVLFVQVAAALWPGPSGVSHLPSSARRARIAVLVPAHDEAEGIAATLRSIRGQLGARDRLLVIADNCSDDTAARAVAAGAEVVQRSDLTRRGKGYALDHGVRCLEADPPEVLLVVDADCELHPGSLDFLAGCCVQSGRPVQALDLMHAPAQAGLKTRIAEFAWLVKNQVRPLGFRRLGLPCPLMGTGMAFPWPLIQAAPLATGHLVEDMRLGLDLAAIGAAPSFCPEARVTSLFPTRAEAADAQRSRWEHGHLGMILREAPRALWLAFSRGRPALFAMVLDLCVPPLTVLLLLLLGLTMVSGVALAFGASPVPSLISLSALVMLALALALAWSRFGRDVISAAELLGAPLYVVAKLPMYARFLTGRKGEWTRTRRD